MKVTATAAAAVAIEQRGATPRRRQQLCARQRQRADFPGRCSALRPLKTSRARPVHRHERAITVQGIPTGSSVLSSGAIKSDVVTHDKDGGSCRLEQVPESLEALVKSTYRIFLCRGHGVALRSARESCAGPAVPHHSWRVDQHSAHKTLCATCPPLRLLDAVGRSGSGLHVVVAAQAET